MTSDHATPAARPYSRARSLRQALAAPLLLAVALQNVGNLAMHAVLGRSLPVSEYGGIGALLAVMVMLTVPLAALQVAASRTAALEASSRATSRRSLSVLAAVAAVAGLLVLAASPVVSSMLHDPAGVVLLGPFLTVSILLAVFRGRLLGLDPSRGAGAMAATLVLSTGVRLALTVALLPSLGTLSVILATFIGEVLALALAAALLRRQSPAAGTGTRPWLSLKDVGWSSLAVLGLFLLTTVDLFLARYYLPGQDSGAYVAAATIGKTLLALPAAVLAVAYPRMVRALPGQVRAQVVRSTALVVAPLAFIPALLVALLPSLVLSLLYGPAYVQDPRYAQMVAALAGIAAVASLVSVLTYALLASSSRWAFIPAGVALLEVGGVILWHDSLFQVLVVSAVCTLIALAALLVAYRSLALRSRTTACEVDRPVPPRELSDILR